MRYPIKRVTHRDNPVMKKISKINPIASQLRRLGKQVVPDKRRDKEDKRLKKEAKDAKTKQDT